MTTDECPSCGMKKDTWPDKAGVTKSGKTYCCQGCADGTGCTCPQTTSGQSSHQRTTTQKM